MSSDFTQRNYSSRVFDDVLDADVERLLRSVTDDRRKRDKRC
jgi:hypothetical protein